MQNLKALSEIAPQYDGILFDIYGVMHNGVSCFEGALACLSGLKAAGTPYAFQGPDSTREIVPEGYIEVPAEAADFVLVSGIGW